MSTKKKPVVQVKKLPAISSLKKAVAKPSPTTVFPEEKFKVSDQDLKWYDAYCALRNRIVVMDAMIVGIASQLRTAATEDRRSWNGKAMHTLAKSAADQLIALQDGDADLLSSIADHVGKDLMIHCGIAFGEREEAPMVEARAKNDRAMLEKYAKRCGVKLCGCGDKCTCHKEKK